MAEADANRTGRGLVIGPYILFRLAERRQNGAGMLVGRRPAAVSAIPRGLRSSSLTPRSVSRAATWWLNADCATLSVSAARDSTPASAMAMKYRICRNPSGTEIALTSNYQNEMIFILYLSDVYGRGKLRSQPTRIIRRNAAWTCLIASSSARKGPAKAFRSSRADPDRGQDRADRRALRVRPAPHPDRLLRQSQARSGLGGCRGGRGRIYRASRRPILRAVVQRERECSARWPSTAS